MGRGSSARLARADAVAQSGATGIAVAQVWSEGASVSR